MARVVVPNYPHHITPRGKNGSIPFVMNQSYLLATVRYVELNPVKARLCQNPEGWLWLSAQAHL